MATAEETMENLNRFLADLGFTQTSPTDGHTYWGDSACTIKVVESSPLDVTVVFEAMIVSEVPMSERLVDFAMQSNEVTRGPFWYSLIRGEEIGFLAVRYALRGDGLRKDDVVYAVTGLPELADLLRGDIQKAFGGKALADYAQGDSSAPA